MSSRLAVLEEALSQPPLTVSAPAKINVILRILDRRPDGYHNLWSIMHTVALEDQLRISLSPGSSGVRLRCDMPQLAVDRTNLVYRAAQAVLERARLEVGLDIELKKQIPMGAGLGGGSSDAAATILGLNQILQLGWSQEQMVDIGQPLGSDVPFFLFAPSAVISGRGEMVRPISMDGVRWAVLINPGFEVETKWAYQELGATRTDVRPLTDRQSSLNRMVRVDWQQLAVAAENDFESPVFAKHARLRDIKENLLAQGAELALLSGSGATVFGLFRNEAGARAAAMKFAGEDRLKIYVVSTSSGPIGVQ